MCNIENPITIGVGDYVRKIRLSIGYTQYDMADAFAISPNVYVFMGAATVVGRVESKEGAGAGWDVYQ